MLIGEATASPGGPALEIPGPVSLAEARAVAGGSRYYTDPVLPDCFVCGMGRGPGDGLRVFPGPLAGRSLWAAPWTPDPSVTDARGRVRPEVAWAALDCPSGFPAAEAAGLTRDTAIARCQALKGPCPGRPDGASGRPYAGSMWHRDGKGRAPDVG